MKRDLDDTSVIVGSGNVFADLGLPDPELLLVKAQFASQIAETIRDRRWTKGKAARVLGIDQLKVTAIVRGQLRRISLDLLFTCLTRLGVEVSFTMTTASKATVGRGRKKQAV